MIPMKLTIENPRGTESSCGSNAAAGFFAREAKSGALLQSLSCNLHQVRREKDIRHKSCHVGDARHETEDHCPTQIGTVDLSGLLYNRPNSMGFDDAPHKECDTRDGHYNGLQCEEVPAFEKNFSDLTIHSWGERTSGGSGTKWRAKK